MTVSAINTPVPLAAPSLVAAVRARYSNAAALDAATNILLQQIEGWATGNKSEDMGAIRAWVNQRSGEIMDEQGADSAPYGFATDVYELARTLLTASKNCARARVATLRERFPAKTFTDGVSEHLLEQVEAYLAGDRPLALYEARTAALARADMVATIHRVSETGSPNWRDMVAFSEGVYQILVTLVREREGQGQ